nr:tetratricopeptide repeat protein [Pseudanabaena sp. ABRG5-3]
MGEANTLQAIGDVLQFLDRRTEALERYEAALAFYREIGDRLGEANTLQAIAILEEDPVIGLASSQAALQLYIEIGTKYSQARNLILFTSELQLKLGQKTEAIDSLVRAAELGREIDYEVMVDYANQKIAEINRDSQGLRE